MILKFDKCVDQFQKVKNICNSHIVKLLLLSLKYTQTLKQQSKFLLL